MLFSVNLANAASLPDPESSHHPSSLSPLSPAISLCPTSEPSYSVYPSVLPPDPHSPSPSPCQPAPPPLVLLPLPPLAVALLPLPPPPLNHSLCNVNSNCPVREDSTVPIMPRALRRTSSISLLSQFLPSIFLAVFSPSFVFPPYVAQDPYAATLYLDILLQSTPFYFNILSLLSKSPAVKLSTACSHASPGSSGVGLSPTNSTHLRQNLGGTEDFKVLGGFISAIIYKMNC